MEEKQQQKRQIAHKVSINQIISGEYVKEEGWMPNYIRITNGTKVSRVNIIGAVVLKTDEQNYKSLLVDDGTAKISIRSFDKHTLLEGIDVGDVVLTIGRPREFNEKYIDPEIIKKVENKLWIEVRKAELKKEAPPTQVITEEIVEKVSASPTDKIFALIKDEDSGTGVDVEEIIKKANVEDAEKIIRNLLEEGEIFELKPGIIKILE